MVDRQHLAEAAELQRESQVIQIALDVINLNPTITAVTLTPSQPEQQSTSDNVPDPVTVPTKGLAYPPQMIQAIQQQLQARYDQIVQQLDAMGVTSS